MEEAGCSSTCVVGFSEFSVLLSDFDSCIAKAVIASTRLIAGIMCGYRRVLTCHLDRLASDRSFWYIQLCGLLSNAFVFGFLSFK